MDLNQPFTISAFRCNSTWLDLRPYVRPPARKRLESLRAEPRCQADLADGQLKLAAMRMSMMHHLKPRDGPLARCFHGDGVVISWKVLLANENHGCPDLMIVERGAPSR
jgi:hypothetical protein